VRFALELASAIAFGFQRRRWARVALPLRDVLGVTAWLLAFTGKRVRWRDDLLTFGRGGSLSAGNEAEY
jgi:hypothetical protein